MEHEALKSDEDVEEILRIAIRKEGRADPDLRERLLASAQDLGISPETLAAAEREHAARSGIKQELAEYDAHRKHEFKTHFITYLCVIAGLFAMNLFTMRDGGSLWAVYPMLGWGIGLAIQGYRSVNRSTTEDDEFRKWRKRKYRSLRDGDDDDD